MILIKYSSKCALLLLGCIFDFDFVMAFLVVDDLELLCGPVMNYQVSAFSFIRLLVLALKSVSILLLLAVVQVLLQAFVRLSTLKHDVLLKSTIIV